MREHDCEGRVEVNALLLTRSPSQPAIGIFARAPVAGKAKTRLIGILGPAAAAELQSAFISDTLRSVRRLPPRIARYVFISGRTDLFPPAPDLMMIRQRGRDLGGRLHSAFQELLRAHSSAVVIGTDSPTLSPQLLRQALREVATCDAVLGPCPDGGFYLLGLGRSRRLHLKRLLREVRWGTAWALRDVLRNLKQMGLIVAQLEPVADIDRPEDLVRLVHTLKRERSVRRQAPATWRFLLKRAAALFRR